MATPKSHTFNRRQESQSLFLEHKSWKHQSQPWNASHFYHSPLLIHLEHQLCYLNQYFLLDPGNWFLTISFFVTDRRPRSQNTDCYILLERARETKGELFIGRTRLYGNRELRHGFQSRRGTMEWGIVEPIRANSRHHWVGSSPN